MKRYTPHTIPAVTPESYTEMREDSEGKWVKYGDVEKMEIALKVISIWAEHPDTPLEEIQKKALEGLGKCK